MICCFGGVYRIRAIADSTFRIGNFLWTYVIWWVPGADISDLVGWVNLSNFISDLWGLPQWILGGGSVILNMWDEEKLQHMTVWSMEIRDIHGYPEFGHLG